MATLYLWLHEEEKGNNFQKETHGSEGICPCDVIKYGPKYKLLEIYLLLQGFYYQETNATGRQK